MKTTLIILALVLVACIALSSAMPSPVDSVPISPDAPMTMRQPGPGPVSRQKRQLLLTGGLPYYDPWYTTSYSSYSPYYYSSYYYGGYPGGLIYG